MAELSVVTEVISSDVVVVAVVVSVVVTVVSSVSEAQDADARSIAAHNVNDINFFILLSVSGPRSGTTADYTTSLQFGEHISIKRQLR